MDPNSPAAESSAHADSDDGGGEVEFANFTDQELGSKIRFCEGELQRGALRKTQDKGKKLRARVGRMKKELDRRIVHRQKQDDTVRRRAVQAKSTCGNGGNVYDFINKCTDGWPTPLSKLEKAKEHDMQILLERAKEFKAKADARTSELVLKRPQCLADLVHSQAGVEKHLLLDLPAESERERSNAHGIHIELQDIQRLLKEDPIDKEIAARRIRMYIHYWTRSYKGACPENLSKLISRQEALCDRHAN